MNLAEMLQVQAATRPNQAALIERHFGRHRRLTFAELDRAAACGARLLRDVGLVPGDAVLVFQPVSTELYVILSAIFRAGLVAMFVEPSSRLDHLDHCCALVHPRAFIGTTKACLGSLRAAALRRIPIKFSTGLALPGTRSWRRADSLPPDPQIHAGIAETPALITFTSGSTGMPKALLRTHGFLLAQHRVLAECLQLEPGEIDLATLPIFVLANLASGVTSLLPDVDLRFPAAINSRQVMEQIDRLRPRRLTASPALLGRLAEYLDRSGRTASSFRKIHTGGGPVFPRLLDQWRRLAPEAEIVAVYGSSEAEPIACLDARTISPADRAAMTAGAGLLAGKPTPHIELRLLRNHSQLPLGGLEKAGFAELQCAPDETGEIVVSGAHVLPAYLNGHGNDQTKFRVDGIAWHRTGDTGRLDGQGRLWLLGRCSARLDGSRGSLHPFSVECAAHDFPGLRRCALASRRGERVLAVEASRDIDIDALRAHLSWAHLDRVLVVKKLPLDRRHNAKIDYPALERMLERLN